MLPMTFAEVAPPLAHGHRLKGRPDHVLDSLRLLTGDAEARALDEDEHVTAKLARIRRTTSA